MVIVVKKYQYKYNENHLKYMKEQIWEIQQGGEDVYSNLSFHEFQYIKDYIGNPKIILDMASGLGRTSIFLNHLLNDRSIQFILADRTGWTHNSGAYNPNKDEYYNDLELAKDFCQLNGIENVQSFDTEIDDWNSLPQVDLVISTCGLGMHVPIKRYIDRLLKVTKPEATLIFGTRASYGPESFADLVKEVIYIPTEMVNPFPRENWLILKKY